MGDEPLGGDLRDKRRQFEAFGLVAGFAAKNFD